MSKHTNTSNNNGISAKTLKMFKANPSLAPIARKLITNNSAVTDSAVINPIDLETIHNSIVTANTNIDSILKLFPDIELAIQILVTSVISPKNMTDTELYFKGKSELLPTPVTLDLLNTLKNNLVSHYKLEEKLYSMVKEIIYTKGAYINAILPESIIDKIINTGVDISNESIDVSKLSTKRGFIKGTKKKELTSLGLAVVDNYELLKLPKLIEKKNASAIKSNVYGVTTGMESVNISDLYRTDDNKVISSVIVNKVDILAGNTTSRPLVLKLPVEAVIPVYVPNDPKHHLGYFVMIDDHGYPVTKKTNLSTSDNGLDKLGARDRAADLISKAKNSLRNEENKSPTIKNIVQVYSGLVENELLNTISSDGEKELGGTEEIFRIMLARSLSNHKTRLLYLPCDIVSYVAYQYKDNGVGKSLLDNLVVISSIRAILLFARIMGHIKGSIPVTEVKIKLDENDPNPKRTVEKAMADVMLTRQQSLPIGINNIGDLTDWAHRLGFVFSYEGNPGLPDVGIDFNVAKIDYEEPSTDLDELLRKQTIMAIGLSPEMVDNSDGVDFATSIVSNNILLAKRVKSIQVDLIAGLSDYVRKISIADNTIRSKLIKIIEDNSDKIKKHLQRTGDKKNVNVEELKYLLLEDFISKVEVTLPSPETATLDTMKTQYENYVESLSGALEAWISEDLITDALGGEVSGYIDNIKNVITAYYLRKWMADNNYLPELSDLTKLTEDGEPVLDLAEISDTHLKVLIESANKYVKRAIKIKKDSNKDLDKIKDNDSDTGSSDE